MRQSQIVLHSASRAQWLAFYILLGSALIAHEVSWHASVVAPTKAGLFGYHDAYRVLIPLVEWNAVLVGMLHYLFGGLALMLIVAPRKREVACLLFPIAAAMFFVQGPKVSNHYFFLLVLLCVHLVYSTLLWNDSRRGPLRRSDMNAHHRFFRSSVLILLMSTYLFAGVAKLNADFLDPFETEAASFVWRMVVPANFALRELIPDTEIHAIVWAAYGAVGICATLFFELVAPFGLLSARTRCKAVSGLLLFHFLILAFSAMDFSTACIACFPIVLLPAEWHDYFTDFLSRWSWKSAAVAIGTTAYFTAIVLRHERLDGLRDLDALYRITATLVYGYATVQFFQFAWVRRTAELRDPVRVRTRMTPPPVAVS